MFDSGVQSLAKVQFSFREMELADLNLVCSTDL